MSIVSSVGKGIGNIVVRGTGLAALGIACYDSHVIGKLEADTYSQSNEANRLTSAAYDNIYLDQPSATMSKVKNKIFNFRVDDNILPTIDSAIGYFKGLFSGLFDNIIPVVLGTGALLGSGKKVPKWSAIGLLLYGGYKLFTELFGLSHLNRLNPPYK